MSHFHLQTHWMSVSTTHCCCCCCWVLTALSCGTNAQCLMHSLCIIWTFMFKVWTYFYCFCKYIQKVELWGLDRGWRFSSAPLVASVLDPWKWQLKSGTVLIFELCGRINAFFIPYLLELMISWATNSWRNITALSTLPQMCWMTGFFLYFFLSVVCIPQTLDLLHFLSQRMSKMNVIRPK